ncbi:MAG TPA: glycosyltransferase family 39 protein [Chitinophagaceae bacterium]|nr:glycosyltransferase family 39 protein [Chitinophagaceae bacterium]
MKIKSGLHFLTQNHKLVFYAAWLLLNLVQSAATELLDDEAYYWVYSKFLDWGYFDHPPMVALLIKAGAALFPGSFGVRFFFAIMSTIGLRLIEKLLPAKDDLLFYCIALSVGLLQIGGIIAVPDTPLLFFSVVFFYVYKKLLERPSFFLAVILGVAAAMMLYSKYHGVLVILFTILSNTKLLARYHIYVAGFTALIIFAPHLYWQYANGFPSLQFHLLERNAPQYRISFTLDYIVGQLLLAGPVAGFLLLYAAFRKLPSDYFERALKFNLLGIYLFFLVSTFKGRVEANWTVPAFIPLIVLSFHYMLHRENLRLWMRRLAAISIVLVCLARLYTIVDVFPRSRFKEDEFHDNREWAFAIQQQAKGLPVFFTDSYQRPSKYWFYTCTPAFSLNTVDYRRNNFNFWPMEETLIGKKVYAIYQGKKQDYYKDSIQTAKGVYLGRTIDPYFSFSRIRIAPQSGLTAINGAASTLITLYTDEATLQRIRSPYDTMHVWLTVYEKDSVIRNIPTSVRLGMIKSQKEVLPLAVNVDLPEGDYVTRFSITSCIEGWPSINSSVIRLKVR